MCLLPAKTPCTLHGCPQREIKRDGEEVETVKETRKKRERMVGWRWRHRNGGSRCEGAQDDGLPLARRIDSGYSYTDSHTVGSATVRKTEIDRTHTYRQLSLIGFMKYDCKLRDSGLSDTLKPVCDTVPHTQTCMAHIHDKDAHRQPHPPTNTDEQTNSLSPASIHAHTNTSSSLMALIGELECVSVWTLGMRNICCPKSQEAMSTTWSELSEFITERYSATIKAFEHVRHTSVMCSQEKGHLLLVICCAWWKQTWRINVNLFIGKYTRILKI